jgi:serine/threonine protein kinase
LFFCLRIQTRNIRRWRTSSVRPENINGRCSDREAISDLSCIEFIIATNSNWRCFSGWQRIAIGQQDLPKRTMQLPTQFSIVNATDEPSHVVSCWRLGEQVTGSLWYNIFRAAPKTVPAESDHDFVIKLINPNLPQELVPLAIDRLGREALATEQVIHPNIIRLLDAELDRAPFFLVQPWVHGRSLDSLLSRAPYLSLSRMLWVLRQTAEGVRAGHEKGRVYLGLDPAHVLIGKSGRVSLIGWSQSHSVDEQAWVPRNQLQLARYMAPECFDAKYQATTASDVYSMGALIYHALALQPPFEGQTFEEVEARHLNDIPEDLIIAQPECPARLGALVKQMLAKNPFARPSFREVLNELISIEIEYLSDTTLIQF